MTSIIFLLFYLLPAVMAAASTSVQSEAPNWSAKDGIELDITTSDNDLLPLQIILMPLTSGLGLHQSGLARQIINIDGDLLSVNTTNYQAVNSSTVVYMSCDATAGGAQDLEPNIILNSLMDAETKPKAIVLYSREQNFCKLQGTFSYESVLTMTDAGDSDTVLKYLDNAEPNEIVKAIIRGQQTGGATDPITKNPAGSNSAVAMSILYSITGLVTLLFLVVIVTGAIRAHRHPERYGPRRALGGRPRQSRAKGLARAVLDTLPIVKFKGSETAKTDLEMKLDNVPSEDAAAAAAAAAATTTDADTAATTRGGEETTAAGAGGPPSVSNSEEATPSGATPKTAATGPTVAAEGVTGTSGTGNNSSTQDEDNSLGCSICTEDFTVGEDVRVLPCNHRYHPPCIDPWLINVSGTCPLCRLDLRTGHHGAAPTSPRPNARDDALPPPLDIDNNASPSAPARRMSRLLDLGRLRHASHDDRLAMLRRLGLERRERAAAAAADDDDAGLRDRFRIRTRVQAPGPSSDGAAAQ